MIQIFLILILVAVIFFAQHEIFRNVWEEGLGIQMKFSAPELEEGQSGILEIKIENEKRIPLPVLMVKFQTDKHLSFGNEKGSVTTDQFYHNDIFQIGGGERVIRRLPFYGLSRGYFKINNVDLTATDILMSGQFHDSFQPDEGIYILPKPLSSRDFHMVLQQLNGEMITKRNLYEDPFEFRGIREYQPFDSMRSINWKATAKTGQFMVNQKNFTAPKTVRIFLNLEDRSILRDIDGMEDCIRLAAGLAKYLILQGIRVAFYTNGLDVQTGDPAVMKAASKGGKHLSAVLRGLARIDLDKSSDASFDQIFRRRIMTDAENIYTCFVCCTQEKEFLTLMEDFSKLGKGFTWFYPIPGKTSPETIPKILQNYVKLIRIC